MSSLILSTDLGEFFRTEVKEAQDTTGISLTEMTEYYVVNLLRDYSRGMAPMPGEEPLALLYKRALESAVTDKMKLFKDLGDVSLYVAGFFRESIERSCVDQGYYISMGGTAYNSLSGIMGNVRRGDTLAELYEQLAHKFGELVELLMAISGKAQFHKEANEDILKLYERWTRTGDPRVKQLLIEKGWSAAALDDAESDEVN